MSAKLLLEEDNKPLHIKWSRKVVLKAKELSQKTYIEAFEARHQYTNYDTLIKSIEVQKLDAIEQSRNIAIIKYECTSKALRCVNQSIRKSLLEAKEEEEAKEAILIKYEGLLGKLRKALLGTRDVNIFLKSQVKELKLEIKLLQQKNQGNRVDDDYLKEISHWKKEFKTEQLRRIKLGRKNQITGV